MAGLWDVKPYCMDYIARHPKIQLQALTQWVSKQLNEDFEQVYNSVKHMMRRLRLLQVVESEARGLFQRNDNFYRFLALPQAKQDAWIKDYEDVDYSVWKGLNPIFDGSQEAKPQAQSPSQLAQINQLWQVYRSSQGKVKEALEGVLDEAMKGEGQI